MPVGVHDGISVTEGRNGESVATPCSDVGDRERDAFGDVPLAAVGGAERHGGGAGEQQPPCRGPIGDVRAHVRLPRPRGHVPVDLPDVVAGDVGADLCELAAVPKCRRTVVADEQAVDAAADRQVELPDLSVAERAGAGAVWRARASRQLDDAHDAASCRTKSWSGIGTEASTRSRTWSLATSSASAS